MQAFLGELYKIQSKLDNIIVKTPSSRLDKASREWNDFLCRN